MTYLYGAAGAIILVFIFIILSKSNKSRADYLLVAVNVLMGLFLVADVWVMSSMSSGAVVFQNAVPLFLFPTFVFYALSYLESEKRFAPKWYLLFLPFYLLISISVIDHFVLNNYPTLEDVERHFDSPSILYHIIFKGSQILFISVLIWMIKEINRFDERIKKGFSSIDTIDLRWLKSFTIIYLSSISLSFVLFLSYNLGLIPFDIKAVFGIIYGLLVISVFYLNIKGIKHYTIAQYIEQDSNGDEDVMLEDKEEFKLPHSMTLDRKPVSGILSDVDLEIEAKIIGAIENEKLYLEPKFTLDDLSTEVGVNKNTVSRIINKEGDRTFYSLINNYRVEHLKSLMRDEGNKHLTILAMGLESGFNSKASLNRIFKLHTGITPKQYMDNKSQLIQTV
ncbi:MAG: hypothetical protein Kapaf2KO_06900 [Candidatus Kapaibacteriales bacterium]